MRGVHYKAFNLEGLAEFARTSAATHAAFGLDPLRKTVGCGCAGVWPCFLVLTHEWVCIERNAVIFDSLNSQDRQLQRRCFLILNVTLMVLANTQKKTGPFWLHHMGVYLLTLLGPLGFCPSFPQNLLFSGLGLEPHPGSQINRGLVLQWVSSPTSTSSPLLHPRTR